MESGVVLMGNDTLPLRLLSLIGSIRKSIFTSDFTEEVRNTQCPSDPIRYTVLPSSDASRLFVFPMTFFVLHYCIHFCGRSYKTKIGHFVVFEQRIAYGNVVHYIFPFKPEAAKHRQDSCIQVFFFKILTTFI